MSTAHGALGCNRKLALLCTRQPEIPSGPAAVVRKAALPVPRAVTSAPALHLLHVAGEVAIGEDMDGILMARKFGRDVTGLAAAGQSLCEAVRSARPHGAAAIFHAVSLLPALGIARGFTPSCACE